MIYLLDFSEEGRDSIASLNKEVQKKVFKKLKWFILNINSLYLLPLKGEYSGLFKLKIGDYRAIYDIDHSRKVITVHKVGHRKDIYKY